MIAPSATQSSLLVVRAVPGRGRLYPGVVAPTAQPGEMAAAPAVEGPADVAQQHPDRGAGSPIFWLLYVMFVMVSASGLMVTAQIAPIAKDFKVAETVIFFGASTLTAALIIDSLCQRRCPAVLRLGVGPDRPRIHHGDRVRSGSRGLLAAGNTRHHAVGFRALRRADLLDVGRDLQPVPLDLHRHLRTEIRHDQSQPALYGERHVGFPGSAGQHDEDIDGQLARGVLAHRGR